MDRLVRSLIHLTKLMNNFEQRRIKFRSITKPFINTTQDSPHNKFITNIFGALAQLERDIIIERTKAGLESARRRGKILGAPKGISEKNKQRAELCAYYFREGTLSVSQICQTVGVSRATYYKYIEFKGFGSKTRKYQSNKIK